MFHTCHCKREASHWKLSAFITYRMCKSGKTWKGTDSPKKYRIRLGRNISQNRSIIKHPNCQLTVNSQWQKHVWKNAGMCGELRSYTAARLYTWRVLRYLGSWFLLRNIKSHSVLQEIKHLHISDNWGSRTAPIKHQCPSLSWACLTVLGNQVHQWLRTKLSVFHKYI